MRRLWMARMTEVASTMAPPATCATVLITTYVVRRGSIQHPDEAAGVSGESEAKLNHQHRQDQLRRTPQLRRIVIARQNAHYRPAEHRGHDAGADDVRQQANSGMAEGCAENQLHPDARRSEGCECRSARGQAVFRDGLGHPATSFYW